MTENKRKHPRIEKKLKSEVNSDECITFSVTQNLSQGGIFISTPEPLTEGSTVDITLFLPKEKEIKLRGIIRWTRDQDIEQHRAGMGIEFFEIDKKSLKLLKKGLKK